MTRSLRSLLVLAAVAVAQPAGAQNPTEYKSCDASQGTGLCMGWRYLLNPGASGTFTVQVWNASAAGTNGRINSFGFWGIGSGLQLTGLNFVDGSNSTNLTPVSFAEWTNGPAVNGFGITGYSAAAGITNSDGDGFTLDPKPTDTPCRLTGGGGQYGQDCWLTSSTKYLEFTFTGNVTTPTSPIVAGFRAQSTGENGNDSFKCGLEGSGVSECSITTVPPVTTVPEPSTYALMGAGLAALAFVRRRRAQPAALPTA